MDCVYIKDGKSYTVPEMLAWYKTNKDYRNKGNKHNIAFSVTPETEQIKQELLYGHVKTYNDGVESKFTGETTTDNELVTNGHLHASKLLNIWGNPRRRTDPLYEPLTKKTKESILEALSKNQNYLDATKDLSDDARKALFEQCADIQLQTESKFADSGTDLHYMISCYLEGKSIDDSKLKYFKIENFNFANQSEFAILLDRIKTKANSIALQVKSELDRKFPDGYSLLSEYGFISKEVSDDLKVKLQRKGAEDIKGTIDLLVIDKTGKLHIFDFKTSPKSSSNWSDDKHNMIYGQLYLYRRMLQAYGYDVSEPQIIAIQSLFNSDSGGTLTKDNLVDHKRWIYDFNDNISIFPVKESTVVKNAIIAAIPINDPNINTKETFEVLQEWQKIIPTPGITTTQKELDSEVEFYINKENWKLIGLNELSPKTKAGQKHKYKFYTSGLSNPKWVYCKNEDELREKIRQYIISKRNSRHDLMLDFSENLDRILDKRDSGLNPDISELSIKNKDSAKAFTEIQFGKYIKDTNWVRMQIKGFEEYGIFMFKNVSTKSIEVVCLDNRNLYIAHKLPLGNSILGNVKDNSEIDFSSTMRATNGNVAILQALSILFENTKDKDDTSSESVNLIDFGDCRITNVRCINPWMTSNNEVTYLNSFLERNYNLLASRYKKLPKFKGDLFYTNAASCLKRVEDLMQDIVDFGDIWSSTGFNYENIDEVAKAIRTLISQLSKTYSMTNLESANFTHKEWRTLLYLKQAELALSNIEYIPELDSGGWLVNGIQPTGYYFSTAANSQSSTIRNFDKINRQYIDEVQKRVKEWGKKSKKAFIDFYKSRGADGFWGGFKSQTNLFKDFFELDEDGNITPEFKLKRYDHAEVVIDPKMQEALKQFVLTMYQLRNNTLEIDEQKVLENDDNYYVPLMQASFLQQVKNDSEGIMHGLWNAARNSWKQFINIFDDMFAEDVELRQQASQDRINSMLTLNYQTTYNRFEAMTEDMRREKINKYGTGRFEINLDFILDNMLVAYSKQAISKKYAPKLSALKLMMLDSQKASNMHIQDMIDAYDKLVTAKFYNEPIISKDLRPVYAFLAILKKFGSGMTLAFNTGSMMREVFQGLMLGFTRSSAEVLPGVNRENYWRAFKLVVFGSEDEDYKGIHDNLSGISKLQLLNQEYHFVNYSLAQIPEQRRYNYLGIANWNRNTLFLTASNPDYLHRMTILIAKMMGDGSWDAHKYVADENSPLGDLTYDVSKDKRFSVYIANRDKNSLDHLSEEERKQYISQKALYSRYIEEFNKEGFRKEDGSEYTINDNIPRAYINQEANSIKNFADFLYGHFDDETRSLVNDMFIGSFIFQYKTYMTAKLEQWSITPGTYNTNFLKQATYEKIKDDGTVDLDEKTRLPKTGLLYRKIIKDESGNIKGYEILKDEELSQSQIDKLGSKDSDIEPYITWEGLPMEGIAQSVVSFFKVIGNPEERQKLWADPMKKANLTFAMNDILSMGLILYLIELGFNNYFDISEKVTPVSYAKVRRGMKEQPWLAQMTYKIATGIPIDGPTTIINAFMQEPPVISNIGRFLNDLKNVLFNGKSIGAMVTNNFGSVRECSAMFNNVIETVS